MYGYSPLSTLHSPLSTSVHIPTYFAQHDLSLMHELIRARPLATIITNGTNGLDAHHIPMTLAPGTLRGHINCANPLVKNTSNGDDVLAIFHGPNMYITPSWYDLEKENGEVVPTWNYVVVHVYGTIRFIDGSAWLYGQLEELVSHNEAPFKSQWRMSDAPKEYLDSLMHGIIGIEIAITRIEGQWKVSQNQPEHYREGVVRGLIEIDSDDSLIMAKLVHQNSPGLT